MNLVLCSEMIYCNDCKNICLLAQSKYLEDKNNQIILISAQPSLAPFLTMLSFFTISV